MECGGCTACCELLEIRETNSPVGKMCRYCVDRCTIYERRPDECRNFNCAWKLDGRAHKTMRPDLVHIMFENLSEDVVLGTMDPKYEINALITAQINAFLRRGSSVVIQAFEDNLRMYLKEGADEKDVWGVIENGLKKYHDAA